MSAEGERPETVGPETVGPEDDAPGGDEHGAEGTPDTVRPDRHMLEALVCPLTRATLSYDAARGELVSRAAHLAFPIRNGIPVMLIDEARKID